MEKNHLRIARAIAIRLCSIPGIHLSRLNYQFSNRIAFARKLASLGIPTALIYLGFIGDDTIASESARMRVSGDWQSVFNLHTAKHFPIERQGHRIGCGAASFWLMVRDLMVIGQSPSIDQRIPSALTETFNRSHLVDG